jgi:nucleotide-binding universal stress UspA family protein
VVAGVDGSDASVGALRAAAALARANGAPLLAVHVDGGGTAAAVRERVAGALPEGAPAPTFVVRAGDPVRELERATRAADGQVLVIGGATGRRGAVGAALRKRARVPLLVVEASSRPAAGRGGRRSRQAGGTSGAPV